MFRKIVDAVQKFRYSMRIQREFREDYLKFLKNPIKCKDRHSWLLMRQAALCSKGKCPQWAWDLQKKIHPNCPTDNFTSIFPEMDSDFIVKAVNDLRNDGFLVLPWRMSSQWIDRSLDALKNTRVSAREIQDVQLAGNIKPKAPVYWHDESDIIKIQSFKELIDDQGILEIISRYLGCQPVFDLATAWWSFPAEEASPKSAQLFHFDMDRIRWLKVFVYLTDVSEDNGPHVFIRGSHNDSLKKCFRDDRHSDDEIFSIYGKDSEVKYLGKAGTVIIEDTFGFHKGQKVKGGSRCMFEYEYSVNNYGWPYLV